MCADSRSDLQRRRDCSSNLRVEHYLISTTQLSTRHRQQRIEHRHHDLSPRCGTYATSLFFDVTRFAIALLSLGETYRQEAMDLLRRKVAGGEEPMAEGQAG